MKTLHTAFIAVASSVLLVACGGGNSPESVAAPAASDMVPASALASVRAYTEFTRSLIASETSQPLLMDGSVPPTSESDSPLPVS